jgi:predicted RNase H-like HicB family nuclease
MHYPVAIDMGTDAGRVAITVPDLPGCGSAAATPEDALAQAREAIVAWLEAALDAGRPIPQPTPIARLRDRRPARKAWIWALVEVDPATLDARVERVNISLPRRVLRRLDALAQEAGETRSGLVARMAMESRAAR